MLLEIEKKKINKGKKKETEKLLFACVSRAKVVVINVMGQKKKLPI